LGGVSTHTYNGLGDRLGQTVVGVTTNYTLDLNAGLSQVLADGETTYLYGLGRIAQVGPEETAYFLGDALGSVRQLTDGSGEVTYGGSYTPYGEGLTSAGTGATAYGYTGEWTDESGMVYLRARYYAPWQGRFMTRDTWGGDTNEPMSYNMWLYGYASPLRFVDRTGMDPEDPCAGLPSYPYDLCTRSAAIPPHISSDSTLHNPSVNPWNITYIGQNLASPEISGSINTKQAQFISNSSEPGWQAAPTKGSYHCDPGVHCGLCGLISVAAILKSVYPGVISANDVIDDFIEFNNYRHTGRTYPDFQGISELKDFINTSYFVYLFAHSYDDRSMLNLSVKNWLAQGSYAIVGVSVYGSSGLVTSSGAAPHWLVVTGISHQWIGGKDNWKSPWNWVRVYNPFTNRTEFYPARFFGPAHNNFNGHAGYVMRVDRYSRNYTEGYIDALKRSGAFCQLPEYIRRRIK
jgi:RHS repeat-associated protein